MYSDVLCAHTHTRAHTGTPFHYFSFSLSVFSEPIYCLYSLIFIFRSEVEPLVCSPCSWIFHSLPFSSPCLFISLSPTVSRISQKQQPRYQSKTCSSILLPRSDKGTARRVTQVCREPRRKQHFSHWSIVLHVNACQLAMEDSGSGIYTMFNLTFKLPAFVGAPVHYNVIQHNIPANSLPS